MTTAVGNALTAEERQDLAGLELVIDRGRKAFVEVGAALGEIRDARLYRETHATFEDYLAERWQMSRPRGYEMIQAAEVARSLSAMADTPAVENERQARALATAPEAERAEVWQEAVARAGGEAPAARVVADVVAEREAERYKAFNAFGKPSTTTAEAMIPTAPPVPSRDGDEWYTPAVYIEAARKVMGGIDLDPASCAAANETVKAIAFYTLADNGLERPWEGRIFMNPPYSETDKWVSRLLWMHANGMLDQAIVLANAKTETAWFNDLWDVAGTVCLVRSRIAFVPGDGGNAATGRHGSAIFYIGPNGGKFAETFSAFGRLAVDAKGA